MKFKIKGQESEERTLECWLELNDRVLLLKGSGDGCRNRKSMLAVNEQGLTLYDGCESLGLPCDSQGRIKIVGEDDLPVVKGIPHPNGRWAFMTLRIPEGHKRFIVEIEE